MLLDDHDAAVAEFAHFGDLTSFLNRAQDLPNECVGGCARVQAESYAVLHDGPERCAGFGQRGRQVVHSHIGGIADDKVHVLIEHAQPLGNVVQCGIEAKVLRLDRVFLCDQLELLGLEPPQHGIECGKRYALEAVVGGEAECEECQRHLDRASDCITQAYGYMEVPGESSRFDFGARPYFRPRR